MNPTIDLRVAELLASRLCHDLISPVGAVKTGIELFTELGDDPDGQTIGLIATSAAQASAKLQFFRLAYGSAGTAASGVTLADAVSLIESVCGSQRTSIETDAMADAPPPGAIKMLLNGALLAADCLPRGGVLRLAAVADGSRYTIRIVARDERAGLDEAMAAALAGDAAVDDLTPKTAHGLFTALLARRLDAGLAIDTAEAGEIAFRFDLPGAAA